MKRLVVVGLMFAVPAFGGQVSEAVIMHEDAVYEYALNHEMTVAGSANPGFAKAQEGNSFAISSDVSFEERGETISMRCTSQFLRTGARSFEVISLQCE